MTANVPETMDAIVITAVGGGPEVLRCETRPVPEPGPGQVLVAVAYAGVNRPDILQRLGRHVVPEGAPEDIPGLEISGTIVALGEGVEPTLLGRLVCALVPGGGYAQYCLACAEHCLPVPEGLAMAEAAAFPETLYTVWHNVFERGWAREGETLLVHGGTSGIGTMATMLAKLFDLTVIVTCGSDDKCSAAREVGADHAINYKSHDFVEQVLALTGGQGVNIILDMVAGDYTQRNLNCLAEDGRLVTIATLGGATSEINMGQLMRRRQTMTGSTLRIRPDNFKTLLTDEIQRSVWPTVEEGALRPVMDQTFPLKDAAAAQIHMEAGDHIGKIVLEVGS